MQTSSDPDFLAFPKSLEPSWDHLSLAGRRGKIVSMWIAWKALWDRPGLVPLTSTHFTLARTQSHRHTYFQVSPEMCVSGGKQNRFVWWTHSPPPRASRNICSANERKKEWILCSFSFPWTPRALELIEGLSRDHVLPSLSLDEESEDPENLVQLLVTGLELKPIFPKFCSLFCFNYLKLHSLFSAIGLPSPFGLWRWRFRKYVILVIIGLQFSLKGGIWYFRVMG